MDPCKRNTEQEEEEDGFHGINEINSCYFDFSDTFINGYNESIPNDQNDILNSSLAEPKSSDLFSISENESVEASEIISNTKWADDLEVCKEQISYSGQFLLKDMESAALSIYGGVDHHTSCFPASPFADSFTMLKSLCTEASPSEVTLASCSENYSLPILPSPQSNARTVPISKRQHFGNYALEKNGLQNSGLNSYQDRFSQYSCCSFPSSINELLHRKLHAPKSEANYLLKIRCPENVKDDGYKWRKYGQKAIKNSPYPRSYYRCTSPKCRAKKQVEKCVEDPHTLTITYEGLHLHYSYSPFPITQQPHHSFPQPQNNIYGRMKYKRKEGLKYSPAMVDGHEQLLQEKDGVCESFKLGSEKRDGVVEEEFGCDGRRDGLLQDIVPIGIINPLSSSSSSSSAASQ